MSEVKVPTAAILIIGNEILSGRTQDANVIAIASRMTAIGVRVREIRVVPDVEEEIVSAVNALRARYDYVFSTGGIGPTHDDITAASMAKAFDLPLIIDERAKKILENYYTPANLTDERLLMARMPQGSELIDNPATAAPGFKIENVFVMAGVPSITQSMLGYVVGMIQHGPAIKTASVLCTVLESLIAKELGEIAARYPDLDIGSYPSFGMAKLGLALVVRGTDEASLEKAVSEIVAMVKAQGDTPEVQRG